MECQFYCPGPLVEIMKFNMNERHIGKIKETNLKNQQLHFPSQVKNRESLYFVHLFSSVV